MAAHRDHVPEKGAANGLATLDGSSKVPASQIPQATETDVGGAELATQAETNTGTDDTRIVTPLKLKTTSLAGRDTDAIHDNVSGEINAVTGKTDLVSDDVFLVEDSENSYAKRKVSLGDLSESISGLLPDQGATQGVQPNITPFMGSWAGWSSDTAPGNEKVYYQRFFLVPGTYDGAEVCLVSGGSSGRNIDIGVYADDGLADPSPTGALLVSTGPQDTAGASETFFQNSFGSNLVVPDGGAYYWVAFVADDGGPKLACTSHNYKKVWQQRLWKENTSYGTGTLGALAGFDSASDGVLFYVGIRRV